VPYLEAFVAHVEEVAAARAPACFNARDHGPDFPDLPEGSPPVSEEERILYRALDASGLRPAPQFPVEAHRLDLAVFDGDRKLDVEVDGRRHHQRWDGERVKRDEIRDQRLIELGWDIRRLWGSAVREDPEACARAVVQWAERRTGAAEG
jgi:very-short-patch-repair endonuclease